MNLTININRKYIPQAKVLVYSVLKNCREDIHLYVTHSELEEDDLKDIESVNGLLESDRLFVHDLRIDRSFMKEISAGNSRWPETVYYRLFAPFLLDERVDRVLYLDSDMVVDGDLTEFYQEEMGDAYIKCTIDDVIQERGRFFERLGLPQTHAYVNSGMILYNVGLIRQNKNLEDLKRVISENMNRLIYPDQDVLNIFYTPDISRAPKKYNYICALYDKGRDKKKRVEEDVVIFHFAGEKELKPWNRKYIGCREDIFWKYASVVWNKQSYEAFVQFRRMNKLIGRTGYGVRAALRRLKHVFVKNNKVG